MRKSTPKYLDRIGFRIADDVLDELQRAAAARGMTASEYARQAVIERLKTEDGLKDPVPAVLPEARG